MKIKFIHAPKGRHYKVGEIAEFKGRVEETYAAKYIARGWAEPYDDSAVRAAERAAAVKTEDDAKTKAASDAKIKAPADVKAKTAYPNVTPGGLRGVESAQS